MLFRSTILFTLALAFILSSCSPQHADLVVAKFGDNEIKMNEFENAYIKNVGSYDVAKKDSLSKLKSFLDLYLNFKMKLRDAEVRGYGEDPALKQELTDYKVKVGVTYLLEKDIVEPGIKDLYNKKKWELRVSHLMIRPDSSGEEAARKLTQAILDSIKSGKSFEGMVSKYSQDSFSKKDGGDIFYVTAGQLPVEFEDAAYNTPKGQVYPFVVRTKYGFHIIKVTDKKERVPQIRASHILVAFNNGKGVPDTAYAKAKLDTVLKALKSGEEFGKVAMQYSDDTGSKQQGGDLNFFERRMMVREFDEAAFNLSVGQVSDVVKTNFGYHIIKVTDKKPYPTFEDDKENLKKIYKQSRYQGEYDSLIARLKIKYNLKVNDNNLNYIASKSDSVKIGGDHPKMAEIKETEVLSYAGNSVKAMEFFNKLNGSNDYVNKLITYDLLKSAANKLGADYLLDEEALNLEKTNLVPLRCDGKRVRALGRLVGACRDRQQRVVRAGPEHVAPDIARGHLGVVHRDPRLLRNEVPAHEDRRGFAGVVRVLLEREPQHRDLLVRDGVVQRPHDPGREPVLLPVVHPHHALPVHGHLGQREVLAQVDEVEDVLLEARAAEAHRRLQEPRPDPGVPAYRVGHLVDIGARCLAERGNRIDRGYPLREERVRHEL